MATESPAVVIVTVSLAVVIATKTAPVLIRMAAELAAVTIASEIAPVAMVTNTIMVAITAESQVAKGVPRKESLPVRIAERNIGGRILGVRKIIVSVRVIGIVGVIVAIGHATAA
jgi:hypothetical protein